MVKKQERSYEEAMDELTQIVDKIEDSSLGIDSLSQELKKAQTLIAFCKERLGKVEQDVKQILEDGQG